jgi:hypothetical protein
MRSAESDRLRAGGSFQRSQNTLFALAKDTGGRAMFDYNDLRTTHLDILGDT